MCGVQLARTKKCAQDTVWVEKEATVPKYRLVGKREVFKAGLPTGVFEDHTHMFLADGDQQAIEYAGMYQRENGISFGNVTVVSITFHSAEAGQQ